MVAIATGRTEAPVCAAISAAPDLARPSPAVLRTGTLRENPEELPLLNDPAGGIQCPGIPRPPFDREGTELLGEKPGGEPVFKNFLLGHEIDVTFLAHFKENRVDHRNVVAAEDQRRLPRRIRDILPAYGFEWEQEPCQRFEKPQQEPSEPHGSMPLSADGIPHQLFQNSDRLLERVARRIDPHSIRGRTQRRFCPVFIIIIPLSHIRKHFVKIGLDSLFAQFLRPSGGPVLRRRRSEKSSGARPGAPRCRYPGRP